MIKNNLHYFNISINNKEKIFDSYYMPNKIEIDEEILSSYIKTINKIKELLITIKQLNEKKKDATDFYKELQILTVNKFANNSEFNCFMNAIDLTSWILKKIEFDEFKEAVNLYIKNRPINLITPNEWVQALIDKGSSRSQGSSGENKIIDLAEKYNFKHVNSWEDFIKEPKAIAQFSTGDKGFNLKTINEKFNTNINFESQNKMLDVIIKSNNQYIIIEAKHLKEGGGSQNKQIKELIDIIKTPIINQNKGNFLYGAFLDGFLNNVILTKNKDNSSANKTTNQRNDIETALHNNSHSFWFNTAGLEAFLKDF